MKAILVGVLALASVLPALTALPMKVSVQSGDTLSFTPLLKDWDSTVTAVAVDITPPLHGTVHFIPVWFDSNTWLQTPMSRARTAPPGFPGFRYVPAPGFTGRDSFFFRIRTSADTTETVRCAVRVTPPEPGGMTVLLIVNSVLLPSVRTGVERLRADLANEGYASRIIPWTVPAGWTTAHARVLWDTLSAEYDRLGPMLAGAIMVGQLPHYKIGTLVKTSAFWCMSLWEPDMDADTTLNGFRVNVSTYGGVHYTPGYANIWVSHLNAANLPQLGSESDLVNRMLQTNHDYRTGASRLPRTACYYDQYPGGGSAMDSARFLDIWPAYRLHGALDTASPLRSEFRLGGELWQANTHGAANKYYAVYKRFSGTIVWQYFADQKLYNSIFSFRFFMANCCLSGGFGAITNQHLLTRNNGCVLASATTDYYNFDFRGNVLNGTLPARQPFEARLHDGLARGDRWGNALLRSNAHIWSHVYHGDLSLKPKMAPSNIKPVIKSVSAVKGSGLSWTFTVTTSDTDDGIASYEWFGRGYDAGRAVPDSTGPSATFSVTYPSAGLCTLRVEAVDHYKARDYAEIILKTDSGIVSASVSQTPGAAEEPFALAASPNPFNPATMLQVRYDAGCETSLKIFDLRGRLVVDLTRDLPAKTGKGHRAETVAWDGKNILGMKTGSGMYLVRFASGGRILSRRIFLTR